MTHDRRLMTTAFPPRPCFTIELPNGHLLRLGERCLVMGILNITPDSFAEKSFTLDPTQALETALRMQAAGADLIDIGGAFVGLAICWIYSRRKAAA